MEHTDFEPVFETELVDITIEVKEVDIIAETVEAFKVVSPRATDKELKEIKWDISGAEKLNFVKI